MLSKAASLRRLPVALCWMALITSTPALAQEGENYTIRGDEGYGIADCMHSGIACGRVIADSWCESHGHAHALTYGMGGDITGSVEGKDAPIKVAAEDVIIRCGD